MRVLLVRHGESEGNASGIIQGRLDYGLTAAGRAQAECVADYLAAQGVTRIVSSPLLRAHQTAEIIAARLGLPIEPDPRLQEYDIGAISGLSPAQVRERFPEVISSWQKGLRPHYPGAEDRDAFHVRVRDVLEHLADSDGTVLGVTHGGVIASACHTVIGLEQERGGLFETANCAVTEVTRDRSGRLVLTRTNDTCHLGRLLTLVDRG
jgi:broad specificity phosphatase PhoE